MFKNVNFERFFGPFSLKKKVVLQQWAIRVPLWNSFGGWGHGNRRHQINAVETPISSRLGRWTPFNYWVQGGE